MYVLKLIFLTPHSEYTNNLQVVDKSKMTRLFLSRSAQDEILYQPQISFAIMS